MSFNVFLRGVLSVRGAQVCQQDRKDNIIRSHGHSSQVHLSALSTSLKTSKLLTAWQDAKRKSDRLNASSLPQCQFGLYRQGRKDKGWTLKANTCSASLSTQSPSLLQTDRPMSTIRLLDGTFGILMILWFQTFLWAVYARSYHKINHEKP